MGIVSGSGGGKEIPPDEQARLVGNITVELVRAIADEFAKVAQRRKDFEEKFKPYVETVRQFCGETKQRIAQVYGVSPHLNPAMQPWIDRTVASLREAFSEHPTPSNYPKLGLITSLSDGLQTMEICFLPNDQVSQFSVPQFNFGIRFEEGKAELEIGSARVNLIRGKARIEDKGTVSSPEELRQALDAWFQRVGGTYAPIKCDNPLSRGEWLDRMTGASAAPREKGLGF